jgi:hypothetical protein
MLAGEGEVPADAARVDCRSRPAALFRGLTEMTAATARPSAMISPPSGSEI